tara:strand:- start:1426 stop:1935 length:510 start_codon:yes stop_codon:yes gene_type:complete
MSEETQVSNETAVDSGTENVTQDNAQNEYIAESKKYRRRAQDAESELSELKKQIAAQDEARLKEKEDFKTLYEQVSNKNEVLSKDAERWKSYESNKRNTLLERHPEDEREALSKLDLETLEYVTNKISKPADSDVVGRAKVATPSVSKPWKDMNEDEKRAYYDFKAKQR